MSLIFYYSPQSSASPVHWALEELGVPYEKVRLDIQAGQTKEPGFLKINPNGKVPVLVHDGVVIWESAAIQIYLGETFGVDKGLYPPPGPRRGEAMKWIVWCNVSVGEAVSRYFHGASPRVPAELRNEKAAGAARKDIARLLGILNDALGSRPYLLGEYFTLADLHLSSWMGYLPMIGIDMTPFPRIAAWTKTCEARPAFARGD